MSREKFSFNLLKEHVSARLGRINTQRGNIDTPTFMTVGTQGTIKSAFIEDVVLSGAQIISLIMVLVASLLMYFHRYNYYK